ncbi:MAG TPA: hypothetical protein HA364_02080 [Thermoplasmata archaeon]|nr:hypothetical protein [Thermoplasmata archaeon]
MLELRPFGYLICASFLIVLVLGQVMAFPDSGGEDEPLTARSMGSETDPVAVIVPLPEITSNGTRYYLNATLSYDPTNDYLNESETIVDYIWEITHENVTVYAYGTQDWYRFEDVGLYKIKLTVRDSWGNTGVNFTAVISVDDADFDDLPDWWELFYFDTMDPGAADDFDSDGYTNLQEWAGGTLPDVADPPPPEPGILEENWMYFAAAAAVTAGVLVAMYPRIKRKRKELETKKIAIAIELEKSLDEE